MTNRPIRDELGRFEIGHAKYGGFSKGSQHSQLSRDKVSASLTGLMGENARRWKGDNASYSAKHLWVKKHYGKPDRCEQLGCSYPKAVDMGRRIITKPYRYEWANISGLYKRERDDWVQLCPSCHQKVDRGTMQLCVI